MTISSLELLILLLLLHALRSFLSAQLFRFGVIHLEIGWPHTCTTRWLARWHRDYYHATATHNRNQRNGRQTINSASLKFLWSLLSFGSAAKRQRQRPLLPKYEAKHLMILIFPPLFTPRALSCQFIQTTEKYRICELVRTKNKKERKKPLKHL